MTINTQIPWYVSWCIQAHEQKNQMYGADKYEVHLGEVNGVAVEFGFVNLFLAMLLWAHDVGEDCKNPATGEKYTLAEFVSVGFPAIVAAAILAITDQEGKDRDEIKAKDSADYRRICRKAFGRCLGCVSCAAAGCFGQTLRPYRQPASRQALQGPQVSPLSA